MKKALITTIPFGQEDKTPIKILEENAIDYLINPMERKFSRDELIDNLTGISFLVAGTDKIDKEILESASELEMISRVGIGLDSVDLLAARDRGISVSYTPEGPSKAVAEFTMNAILSTLRNSALTSQSLKKGIWKKKMGRSVSESVIGVFGAGRIGSELIHILACFKPRKILVYDPYVDEAKFEKNEVEFVSKNELLENSDLVTLHLPMSDSTKDFIAEKEIKAMKPNSIIINTSRGGIVNEDDLFSALKIGHLSSAAIDVFEEEPYSGNLLDLDNCITTPHMAPMSKASRISMEIDAVKEVVRFANGESLINQVPEFEYQSRVK